MTDAVALMPYGKETAINYIETLGKEDLLKGRGRLSTMDLLLITSLDRLLFYIENVSYFRSTTCHFE